jgi:hypothetical protein
MQFRQPFQARTDIVKLVNFVEDSLKSLFIRAKCEKTSDELLSSEDLKEEKVITTPTYHYTRYSRPPFSSLLFADK